MDKFNCLFHWSFLTICLGLCLYQISKICEIYFSYKTTISMSFEDISEISLPAVSICVNKTLLLRDEFFTQMSINKSDKNMETIKNVLKNMTIKEQIDAMFSEEYVFQNSKTCAVLRPKGIPGTDDRVPSEEISPFIKSIDENFLCFTLFSQFDGQSDDRYIVDYSELKFRDLTEELVYFQINQNITSIHVYLHSRKERLYKYFHEKTGINCNFEKGFVPSITYKKVIIRSLSKPYETNCFDYQKMGYNSNRECISQCRINNWERMMNGQWPGIYFTSNFNDAKMFDVSNESGYIPEKLRMDKIIGDICRKQCHSFVDCYSESYELKIEKIMYMTDMNWISIQPPSTPDQVIQHSPKITFEEFICFVGSLIGLYFGSSVIMLSKVCSLVSQYFIKIVFNFKTNINNRVKTINRP